MVAPWLLYTMHGCHGCHGCHRWPQCDLRRPEVRPLPSRRMENWWHRRRMCGMIQIDPGLSKFVKPVETCWQLWKILEVQRSARSPGSHRSTCFNCQSIIIHRRDGRLSLVHSSHSISLLLLPQLTHSSLDHLLIEPFAPSFADHSLAHSKMPQLTQPQPAMGSDESSILSTSAPSSGNED